METAKPSWILLQNAYGLVIGYITYFMIFRHAGVVAFGIFSFALSFGLIFSFVSDLGINTAHVRMIAAGKDRNEYNNALVLMKVFLTAIYVAVILLSIFFWTVVLHHGFEYKYEYYSILLLFPYFVSLPYIQANRAFFTGTMEAAKMSFPAIVESTVRLAAIVAFIRFNIFNLTNLNEMALLIAVSYSISYAVYAILSFAVGRPWNFKWPRREVIGDYLKYSYPLMGVAVASAVSGNLAQILIQLSNYSFQLGGYAGSLRIIAIVTGFTTSVTVLILPILTSHFGTKEEYGKTVGLMTKYLAVFITPITVFAIIFASPILNIWTEQLIPFTFTLQILLSGTWFTTMSIPYWTHFNAIGRTRISGGINIAGYLLTIALDLVLIPSNILGIRVAGLGVNGAAYASLISGIVLLIVSIIALGRTVKIPITFESLRGIVISLLLGVPFYYFLHSDSRMPALYLLAFFIIYALAYMGLLIASRTLSKQEMLDILNMVNVKKMARYAIDELKKPSQ